MKKISIISVLFLLYSNGSWSQWIKESTSSLKVEFFLNDIPVTNNSLGQYLYLSRPTINDIVPNIQGEGIQIINISNSSYVNLTTYSEPYPLAVAKFFFDGSSDIGIDTGVVLNTGFLTNFNVQVNAPIPPGRGGIVWPAIYTSGHINPMMIGSAMHNGEKSQSPTSCWQGASSPWRCNVQDSDLNSMLSDSIVEANIIEFDFIPEGDSIALQYVFASEEYPNFSPNFSEPTFTSTVCDPQTDVMGIFLSGPGIQGSKNIALVPGTDLPVGINTITPPGWACGEGKDNSQYYVDNSEGENVIYNGFTTVLTAKAAVISGETYHLRIGVADAALHLEVDVNQGLSYGENWGTGCGGTTIPRRGLFDSGIFIKSRSFVSWTDTTGTDTNTRVAEINNGLQFQIVPNPFQDYFQISKGDFQEDNYEMMIANILGNEMARFSGNLEALNQQLRTTPQLLSLASGMYIVQIRNVKTGKRGVVKLMKE